MERFTEELVDKLADLHLIGLTREENKMVVDEMESIDATINIINEIPGINEIEPMSWCLDGEITELREDVAEESIPLEEALKNCDVASDGEPEVPRVVG